MRWSPLWCRTSIIRSSALVQASSSLSMVCTRAWRGPHPPQSSIFTMFFAGFFIIYIHLSVYIYVNTYVYTYIYILGRACTGACAFFAGSVVCIQTGVLSTMHAQVFTLNRCCVHISGHICVNARYRMRICAHVCAVC